MSELVLLLSAEIDVQAAFDRYEDYQEGRGAVFLQPLRSAFEQLRRFPRERGTLSPELPQIARTTVPYGIFYAVELRGVVVTAIMDTHQDLRTILRRLR